MIYNGIIEDIDEDGEEVKIKVENNSIIGFVNCGAQISIGDQCNFEIQLYGDLDFIEISDKINQIEKIGNGYSYYIRGKLDVENLKIHSIIDFELEKEDVFDYSYLDNKYIQVKVQRMDISFNN